MDEKDMHEYLAEKIDLFRDWINNLEGVLLRKDGKVEYESDDESLPPGEYYDHVKVVEYKQAIEDLYDDIHEEAQRKWEAME